MIDAITGYCGRINVFQQEGEGGTAYVRGTVYVDRVPRGMNGDGVSLQWLGLRAYNEPVDPRPPAERDKDGNLLVYLECAYIGHLETHKSLWVRQDEFSPRAALSKRGRGVASYCKACQAHYMGRIRKRQTAQAQYAAAG